LKVVSRWKWAPVALVAFAALGAGAASAQQQEPVLGAEAQPAATPAPAAWASQCASDGRAATPDCSVFQRGVTQTGQVVGSVTIRIPPGATEPVMIVSAPLGLFVPAGISYSIDGASPQILPIQTCDQSGCFASQPVTQEMLGAMFKGQKLDIAFSNMNQQAITLPLSLVGFTAAYDRIK
jgi:invasion protein IalB